jgi:hypothetical protein
MIKFNKVYFGGVPGYFCSEQIDTSTLNSGWIIYNIYANDQGNPCFIGDKFGKYLGTLLTSQEVKRNVITSYEVSDYLKNQETIYTDKDILRG